MILRILTLLLAFTVPLSATSNNASCNGCNECRQQPSAFESLQTLQAILNSGTLLLPQLQAQLAVQLQQIITAGGVGIVGAQGATGAAGFGGILDFADFFALMPGDNSATVAVGGDVDFPQNGPASGTGLIASTGANTFNLAVPGFYQILFQVSISEAGQLVLTLNNVELPDTVVGRDTGTSQLTGIAIVETLSVNSILTVRNPLGNSTALTITPIAGGTDSVSAHLVITRLQ